MATRHFPSATGNDLRTKEDSFFFFFSKDRTSIDIILFDSTINKGSRLDRNSFFKINIAAILSPIHIRSYGVNCEGVKFPIKIFRMACWPFRANQSVGRRFWFVEKLCDFRSMLLTLLERWSSWKISNKVVIQVMTIYSVFLLQLLGQLLMIKIFNPTFEFWNIAQILCVWII